MLSKSAKIFVAGHNGLVGSAIVRELRNQNYNNIITVSHCDLDLTIQADVEKYFGDNKPEYVFLAAAKVGGIKANSDSPADFFYMNSMIQNNVINSAYKFGVKKLLFLGSSCIFPKNCPQPIKEESLLSGYLEETNEAYAVAKISGLKMCQYYRRQYGVDFISAMPTNLYGPNDNFDLETSHVLPALIRRFHEAKINGNHKVTLWGTGSPKREFLHVDDLANACVFLMENYSEEGHINVGTGVDLTIRELAGIICEIVDYSGSIEFDITKPDGTMRKVLDVSRIQGLGWSHKIGLHEGIDKAYEWYKERVI